MPDLPERPAYFRGNPHFAEYFKHVHASGALDAALGSRGVPTLLIEKVSREVHSTRGDLLHPPTLRLLDRWGVLAALHADGALPITELAVSHAQRGLIARFD